MSVLTDGTSRLRGRQKLDLLLRWLSRWRYAPDPAAARLLGIAHVRHVQGFLARCVDRGYLDVSFGIRSHPRTRVYSLTPFAQMAKPELELRDPYSLGVLARLLRRDSIHHTLAMQHYALLRPDPWAVSPVFSTDDTTSPDLLETTPGGDVAIEIEHTQKSAARIYRTLANYLEQIDAGKLAGVRYVFPTARLAATYRQAFDRDAWPTFYYFRDTRKYAPAGDPRILPATDPRRALFSFEVNRLWPQSNF
jgi:hypothetical protein